ncbi:MAG: hypothetical protein DMF62_02375 [Acidobacteria bacterium]|nr:MAG: hypothetical protein DMF62_02375 [Acidobacteriota bacterium]
MSAKPCRGCGKLVVFAKDPDGKWQVLDASAPVWRQSGVKEGVAQVVRDSKAMVSHFSTCADANKFSASKKPERNFYEAEGAD